MIAIEQLRYVVLGTGNLPEAARFAQELLGLQPVDRNTEAATFRSDNRDFTLALQSGDPAFQAVGFEVRHPDTLSVAHDMLRERGLPTGHGTPDECAARKAKALLWFNDHSGNRIELVVRPMNSGWRYFPSRDAGITGLDGVVLRSTAIEKDEALWTGLLGAKVSDWVGDASYLRIDGAHHRVMLVPAARAGVLAVEYAVESVNLLMRNYYVLQNGQIRIMHGPGRRPASEQLFLTFAGPDEVLYSFVAEGVTGEAVAERPRQFPAGPAGFCSWGSENRIEEFTAGAAP